MITNYSEEFVLFYAMLDWDRFGREAVTVLDSDWLLEPFNQRVLTILKEANSDVDQNALTSYVTAQLDRDGVARLGKWATSLVWHQKTGRSHFDWHLNQLRQQRLYREMNSVVGSMTERLEQGEIPLADLRQECDRLERESTVDVTQTSMAAVLDSLDPSQQGEFMGIGFPLIDERINGFRPGDLITVGATPGMGKTSFALHIARHNCQVGRTVIFASYEMKHQDLMYRILASEAQIPLDLMFNPDQMNRDDRLAVVEAANAVDSWPLVLFEPRKRTTEALRAYCDKTREKGSLGLIVVDYMQRMAAKDERAKTFDQITQLSMDLKNIAMDLDVPVLALCQLNREAVREGQPKMHHLRGSGQIEQDSDVIILIGPGEDRSQRKITIPKVRRGEPTGIHLQFNGSTQRWSEANRVQEFDDWNEE